MKKLKLDHALAELVTSGQVSSTWRLYDDKDLAVNDQVLLIDKVNPQKPNTWKTIGVATIDSMSERRLGGIENDELRTHGFQSRNDMLETYHLYYGSNVDLRTPVKMINFHFDPHVPEGHALDVLPHAEKVIIYADGGSRGNPGPSASGYAIYDEHQTLLIDHGVYLGITTNNQAEYMALKLALEEALALGAREVHVYMDSLLVVNQMRGVFKVKNRELWPIHEAAKRLALTFTHADFTQVPRESNKVADAAVNAVLDQHLHDQQAVEQSLPA